MVVFSGFDTVGGLRQASRQKKADAAAVKAPASKPTSASTEKPVTNTSGTAKKNGGAGTKQLQKQVEFGMAQGGIGGALAAFMGKSFTSRRGPGSIVKVDTVNQQLLPGGSPIKAPASNNTAAKKTTVTSGSGIDAPAPDTGWRPSGVNTASGLMSAEMGVPLQETVGVSKRKR